VIARKCNWEMNDPKEIVDRKLVTEEGGKTKVDLVLRKEKRCMLA
jgi:hypothetical protein